MIITNNDTVYDAYKNDYNVIFIDGGFKDVLLKVRDYVHKGHELLTHPLSSSIKPNETPYKSVIISDEIGQLNYESVVLIENCIMAFDKFAKIKLNINYTDKVIEDFKLIDKTVIDNAMRLHG